MSDAMVEHRRKAHTNQQNAARRLAAKNALPYNPQCRLCIYKGAPCDKHTPR